MTDAVANTVLSEALVTDPGTIFVSTIGLEAVVTDAGTIYVGTFLREYLVSDLTSSRQTAVTVIS